MSNTFLYFAYGSNLLRKRLRLNNPTAVFKDIGFIKNFRLDFNYHSKRWQGASATIVPTEDYVVWGVIWELEESNLSTLDNQEGVADKIYFPMDIEVETTKGVKYTCRVYQQCNNPKEHMKLSKLPLNRQPSPLYLNTIISGAKENKIPMDYIKLLNLIKHNNYSGEYDINLSLTEK